MPHKGLKDGCADGERERVAEVDAPVVDAERGAAQLDAEVLGYEAGGERIAASLAEAEAKAQNGQLPVGLRQAAQRGHQRPEDQTHREYDDAFALEHVGEHRDQYAREREDDDKGRTGQHLIGRALAIVVVLAHRHVRDVRNSQGASIIVFD